MLHILSEITTYMSVLPSWDKLFIITLTGLKKKIGDLAGKRVAFRDVGKWTFAIVRHLYHVVSNTDAGSKLR